MRRHPPVSEKLPGLIHGSDWYPDQWQGEPHVLSEDLRLMEAARFKAVSVGMFAWSALEPEEGSFRFEWLDRVMNDLLEHGIFAILGTPSGARPAWMARRYPEVLRAAPDRRRNLYGFRHNHCFTSPVYREKTRRIDSLLAERYARHPALILWHVSNEYGGECHCELCQEAFRQWLRRKYRDDLDALNHAWWTLFWGHAIGDWREIESPAPHGEPFLHGLNLDWKRFVTDQTVDFMKEEISALRSRAPGIPVTTNLMGAYAGLNYEKLAPHLDVVSWDSYPAWHGSGPCGDSPFPWDPLGRDWVVAADTAFSHDLMRSLKGRPFMLMESSPTFSSWHTVRKLKRPGMHALSSLLAVAHGSDTVQYFQWRAGRGGHEKLHGAVLDHSGCPGTRVFQEVAALGQVMEGLRGVAGTSVLAETAVVFDWENLWALENDALGRPGARNGYEAACRSHYRPLWQAGVPVDVVGMDADFSRYPAPRCSHALNGARGGGGTPRGLRSRRRDVRRDVHERDGR